MLSRRGREARLRASSGDPVGGLWLVGADRLLDFAVGISLLGDGALDAGLNKYLVAIEMTDRFSQHIEPTLMQRQMFLICVEAADFHCKLELINETTDGYQHAMSIAEHFVAIHQIPVGKRTLYARETI